MTISRADLQIASSAEPKTHGNLNESFAPEIRQTASTIASLSIFGTPSDQGKDI